MEQWKQELEGALKKRLEDSEDEFEDNFIMELCQQVLDKSITSSKQPRIGSSRSGRRYVY